MVDYNKSSILLALDMINKRIEGVLRPKDVEIKNVTYLDEGYYNTKALLQPVLGGEWQDAVEIEYDRINVASLFRGIPVKVVPAYQKKLSEYLPAINEQYGLAWTEEDIVDGIIPVTQPPFKVVIEIKPDNPAFYGKFELIVTNHQKSIRTLVDGISFGGIQYPTDDPNRIQGPLYFYGPDMSELRQTFELYMQGDKVDDYLIEQINLYDNNIWVKRDKPQPFNLEGARILYNDVIGSNNQYTNRDTFTNVFVIGLDEKLCTNVAGYLVFHYNTI